VARRDAGWSDSTGRGEGAATVGQVPARILAELSSKSDETTVTSRDKGCFIERNPFVGRAGHPG
jgi:hypothetical protein